MQRERETASVIELTVHVISHLSSLQSRANDEESGAHVNVRRENSSEELQCLLAVSFLCEMKYETCFC